MRLFRRKWTVVVVGRHSGLRVPLRFLTFRTYEQAASWCINMNSAAPTPNLLRALGVQQAEDVQFTKDAYFEPELLAYFEQFSRKAADPRPPVPSPRTPRP